VSKAGSDTRPGENSARDAGEAAKRFRLNSGTAAVGSQKNQLPHIFPESTIGTGRRGAGGFGLGLRCQGRLGEILDQGSGCAQPLTGETRFFVEVPARSIQVVKGAKQHRRIASHIMPSLGQRSRIEGRGVRALGVRETVEMNRGVRGHQCCDGDRSWKSVRDRASP